MKCSVCGKEATSVSMITGIYEPCGHSKLSKATQRRNKQHLYELNRKLNRILVNQK